MTTRIKYDKTLLEQVCERDKCIIDFSKIDKYNRDIKIDFTCNCNNKYTKTFRQLYEKSGGFCKECTKKNGDNKIKQNSVIKYGVEHPSKLQEIKDKVKKTCINKYGTITPLQSEEVKNKIKETNLIKYGVEHNSQIPEHKIKCKNTFLKKYGVEHNSQTQEYKEKYKNTCLKKYNTEHPFKSDEIKEKIKETCLTKYGYKNPLQSQEIKNKAKKTNLEKYGTEYANQSLIVKNKIKETNLIKYGVEYATQSEKIKNKTKETCINKYGVDNISLSEQSKNTCLLKYGTIYPMQNATISEKSSKNSYKLKSYTFYCGNEIQIQGYEPFLLNILVKDGYTYNNIITKRTEIPEIWYNKNDKKCRYFCDIYIPKKNTIYEVKSTWTYKKDIEDIPLKKQACIDAGYKFELYVFDSKGIRQYL